MNLMKRTCLPLLFLLLPILAKGNIALNDSTASIVITAKEHKNKTLLFHIYPTFTPSVTLDSDGSGKVTIPVKEPRFLDFGLQDSVFYTLLLEPGYDLHIHIDKGISTAEGRGAAANNYLLQVKPLIDSLASATNERSSRNKEIHEFLDVMQSFERRFNDFHEAYISRIHLSAPVDYLLKHAMKSRQLCMKQRFINRLDRRINDSLQLESKLGVVSHGLFRDTLLIHTGYNTFRDFLIFHGSYTIQDSIFLRYPEKNVYADSVFYAILNSRKYSPDIREYLAYWILIDHVYNFGSNSAIERLYETFYTCYPASPYSDHLKRHFQKHSPLARGNAAPDFQGSMLSGWAFSLKDYKGKVILIDVWATWCGPCKKELPYTYQLQQTFHSNKELSVIYLSIDSDKNNWKSYLHKNQWLAGIHINTRDPGFLEAYKITAIPRYILIGKDGNLIDAFCDNPSAGTLEKQVRAALCPATTADCEEKK